MQGGRGEGRVGASALERPVLAGGPDPRQYIPTSVASLMQRVQGASSGGSGGSLRG